MNQSPTIRERLSRWIAGREASRKDPHWPDTLSSVSSRVDESPGWTTITGRPHERTSAEIQDIYEDALKAWRKNPIAWRITAITSNYVVGDEIVISSPNRNLNKYIHNFWNHPKNMMDQRLEPMCDELSRAGDLFVALFRNEQDGMSYIRFITKDRIQNIDTANNDWESELAYYETQDTGEPKKWLSIHHPSAADSDAVMLHYSINKPIGALLGESDLTTMIPWLMRYSRMLEDRVRLNWAVRAFLWIVTVPSNKVKAKMEQYRNPPEAGSIVVKDESEKWEVTTPLLRASDAQYDLRSVRNMIDAGSGYPPHWRGEAEPANLATARAMTGPTERQLIRRQKYFHFMLQDILYQGYQRAVQVGRGRQLKHSDYDKLFVVTASDLSRSDNESLAKAARDFTQAMYSLSSQLHVNEPFSRRLLRLSFKFAGEPISEAEIDEILSAPINVPGVLPPSMVDDPDISEPDTDSEVSEPEQPGA
jgi:hypothetical protein